MKKGHFHSCIVFRSAMDMSTHMPYEFLEVRARLASVAIRAG